MDSVLQTRLRVKPDTSYITTTKRWTSLYPYLLTSLFFSFLIYSTESLNHFREH